MSNPVSVIQHAVDIRQNIYAAYYKSLSELTVLNEPLHCMACGRKGALGGFGGGRIVIECDSCQSDLCTFESATGGVYECVAHDLVGKYSEMASTSHNFQIKGGRRVYTDVWNSKNGSIGLAYLVPTENGKIRVVSRYVDSECPMLLIPNENLQKTIPLSEVIGG